VAAEVRSLAEQSKAGTAQVRSILGDIQNATDAAVMATEKGITVVADGRDQAGRAGDAISRLSGTIRATAEAAQQISSTAQQQSVAIDQIASAMSEINQATAQYVAGVDDTHSEAQELTNLADQLAEVTAAYRFGDGGAGHGPGDVSPHRRAAREQVPEVGER
jgi:methyl-accepting chemotaxis protein